MPEANTIVLSSEMVSDLTELLHEAQQHYSAQQSFTKIISDIYEGREILSQVSLAKANNALMSATQMYSVACRVSYDLRNALPEGYKDIGSCSWNEQAREISRNSLNDIRVAQKQAKEISSWASIKIDGTIYDDK